MENGSFHTRLNQFDFIADQIPTPDQVPALAATSHLPYEILKSQTIESLLSQNEDLAARLKVNLKRLDIIEEENRQLRIENERTHAGQGHLKEQVLVWTEKEKMWQNKLALLEEQVSEFRSRFPDYLKMEAKLARFEKYQEKIKTQVKPYLKQLRDYSKALTSQIQELNNEVQVRDQNINQLQIKNHDLQIRMEREAQQALALQKDLTENYEKKIDSLANDLAQTRVLKTYLQTKADKLEQCLEKMDLLENENISLRRIHDEQVSKFESEVALTKKANHELKIDNHGYVLKIKTLNEVEEQLRAKVAKLDAEYDGLTEQISSVRYMWSQKSDELEKAKLQIAALEKLNHELSQKLNQQRLGEAEANPAL